MVLVGIDDARRVAYLHDPASDAGAALEVPLEQLLDAWDDGDRRAVVTEEGAGSSPATTPPIVLEVVADDGPDAAALGGYVLLPVSLAATALSARRREG